MHRHKVFQQRSFEVCICS